MPSVCIHVRKNYSESEEVAIMNAVHAALVTAFGLGPDDKNITLMVHPARRFMCPPDRDDPERYVNVAVVGHASRTMEAKRRFYTAVVDNLEALGIPRNCSLIHLHELPPEKHCHPWRATDDRLPCDDRHRPAIVAAMKKKTVVPPPIVKGLP